MTLPYPREPLKIDPAVIMTAKQYFQHSHSDHIEIQSPATKLALNLHYQELTIQEFHKISIPINFAMTSMHPSKKIIKNVSKELLNYSSETIFSHFLHLFGFMNKKRIFKFLLISSD